MKKQEISQALDGVVACIAQLTNDGCDEAVRKWLMAATLRIWAANRFFAKDYVDVLSVFTGEEHTMAQVITAMDCAGEENRRMTVPDFFREIVSRDKENYSSESRAVASAIGCFLALAALVNGDFTIEEASALRGICDLLLSYCDRQGVVAGQIIEYRPEMVTDMNMDSYYQPISENTAANPARDNSPAASPKYEDAPDATVNLGNKSVKPEESEANAAEIGVAVQTPASADAAEADETLESVLAQLYGLVGLDKVKNDVQSLLNFIKICQMRTERGMKVPTISYHLVFTGNPGTGKTTVARLVAKLYYLMGILPQGQLVETDRSGLVAGYLGQTAIKTQKVIQEALGGVLFIDEAYALANDKEDSYGKEAIETILKAMEDHRDELVVIVAGYDELMHNFINSNPGLRSRFNKYFHFPDYDGNDLLLIFKRFCDTNGYILDEAATPLLQLKLDEMYAKRDEHFGNARAVRNLFEHAINQQANRLVMDDDITDRELAELTLDDILPAMEVM